MVPMLRAVLDANIILRGLLRRSLSAPVLVFDALVDGHFVGVTTPQLLAELGSVLRRPRIMEMHLLNQDEVTEFLSSLREIMDVQPGAFVDVEKVPTDVKDNPLVAAALEGRAEYLVSEDKHDLVPLKDIIVTGYRPVHVVRATEFLHLL